MADATGTREAQSPANIMLGLRFGVGRSKPVLLSLSPLALIRLLPLPSSSRLLRGRECSNQRDELRRLAPRMGNLLRSRLHILAPRKFPRVKKKFDNICVFYSHPGTI